MHHHHEHNPSNRPAPHRSLLIALVLTLGFAVVEVVGGYFSGSLALMGDAGHLAMDALAIGLSAFAAWFAAKPPSRTHSYGFGRIEVIAAWASSLLMLGISLTVIIEAIRRMEHPTPVNGGPVILIASIGILMNLILAILLAKNKKSLNTRAVFIHVLGDLLGTLAALISGAVIYLTHWTRIDPILSIVIGGIIFFSSIQLIRESLAVLMEGVPTHLNIHNVSETMIKLNGVKAVHDLHIWTLSSGVVALSAHVNVDDLSKWEKILKKLNDVLKETYHIGHITLQPEAEITQCKPCYKL